MELPATLLLADSNQILQPHPSRQPRGESDRRAEQRTGHATRTPDQRADDGTHDQARNAEQQRELDQADGVVEDADVGQLLPLLPAASSAWGAAARPRRGPELGAGLPGVRRLNDPAGAAERLCGENALGAVGQGLRAVHLVEMRLVDF